MKKLLKSKICEFGKSQTFWLKKKKVETQNVLLGSTIRTLNHCCYLYKANERFYEINHHRILISNWILEVRFFFYVKSKFYSLFSFILITYKNNSLNATKIILSFFSKFLFSPKNCVLITSISPCNWWTSNHAMVWVLIN